MNRPDAEEIAISALSFLAMDPGRLSRFLDLTWLAPSSIRQAANDKDFLLSVLDHIMQDDSLLLSFSETGGINPDDIVAAHGVLGAPAGEHR